MSELKETLSNVAFHIRKGYETLAKDDRYAGNKTDWNYIELSKSVAGEITTFKACAISCASLSYEEFEINEMLKNYETLVYRSRLYSSLSQNIPVRAILDMNMDNIPEDHQKDIKRNLTQFYDDGVYRDGNVDVINIRNYIIHLNDRVKLPALFIADILDNISEKI